MTVNALDSLKDPLITPILGLLRYAINADLAALMIAQSATPTPAVLTTSPVPFVLGLEGNGVLPSLHCWRIRSKTKQGTLYWWNHTATLQFVYVTPAAGRGQIEARWPILERVWHSLVSALRAGSYAGYQNGAEVLEAAGVVRVATETASKQELFVESNSGASFPGFVATIDVVWRDTSDVDTSPLYPALSIDGQIFANVDTTVWPPQSFDTGSDVVDGFGNLVVDNSGNPVTTNGMLVAAVPVFDADGNQVFDADGNPVLSPTTEPAVTPDVIARTVFPAGTPPGRNFTPPSDWSL